MRSLKLKEYKPANDKMKALLKWLWDVAVEPVLNDLHLDGSDSTSDTRIWWVGMGNLCRAPFHAAGDHLKGSINNTISRVMPSYAPTPRALAYSRGKSLKLSDDPQIEVPFNNSKRSQNASDKTRMLFASMPTTAGNSKLNTEVEFEAVKHSVRGSGLAVDHMDMPSASAVVDELDAHDIVHFACHGVSDATDPSNSHLLRNPDSDIQPTHLTVKTILNNKSEKAQVAYVSACSTAENKSKLEDESIHTASAFQLAGFSHVLATL